MRARSRHGATPPSDPPERDVRGVALGGLLRFGGASFVWRDADRPTQTRGRPEGVGQLGASISVSAFVLETPALLPPFGGRMRHWARFQLGDQK
jgi:hypothetical protein